MLDWNLCYSIHDLIDRTNVEKFDPVIGRQFNMICAVIDRVRDSLNYLNEHDTVPRSDDSMLLYFVHACIILDAAKQMHQALGLPYPGADAKSPDDFRFFGEAIQQKPLCIPKEKLPTDDKFFEYFRSLVFAHPFETSHARFLDREKGEVQYSPFVIHGHSSGAAPGEEDMIGVRIYSNIRDDIVDSRLEFKTIQDYIASRYAFLTNVRDHIKGVIERQREEWKRNAIDRSQPVADILRDIVKTLKSRFVDSSLAEDAVCYYTTPLTPGLPENDKWVDGYRKLIEAAVPVWCDLLDSLDHEGLINAMEPLLSPQVPLGNDYNSVGYQLEKIFCHLGEDSDYGWWAGRQLKEFAAGFAAEWVTIRRDMSVDEAHLLVTVACFFEFARYEKTHPEAERPCGLPQMPNGAGVRRIVIGELPSEIKKGNI